MRLRLIIPLALALGLAGVHAQVPDLTNAAPALTNSPAAAATNATPAISPSAPVLAPSPPPTNWGTFTAEASTNAAPAASAVAPATNAAAVSPTPAPAAASGWKPGDPFPAQDNWTWTVDGKEYDNVVVTGIDAGTVSITHSLGVGHLDMTSLPPELQQRLGYDPAAAAAARREKDREDAHPYFRLAELADAQATARQLHWPLAWICGDLASLSANQPTEGDEDEITQMSVDYLKSRAVVVFLDGNNELTKAPPAALQQYYHFDEGSIPGGHHFYSPKIVFTDPDAKLQLGRVWYTEMKTGREAEIEAVLAAIANDPAAQAALQGTATNAVPATPAAP